MHRQWRTPESLACTQCLPIFRTHRAVPAPAASIIDPPLAAYSIVTGLLFNRFEMAFAKSPVREIAVSFEATDSDHTEVKRMLQIIIPELVIS
jgi:hypothetical protein